MATGIYRVTLGDEDLGIFDEHKFTLNVAFVIKASCGMDVKQFMAGINSTNPLAIQTFVWWLKHRKGVNVDRASIDFNMADLKLEDEPDPITETSGTKDADTSVS
jgi:hypothetical protein